MQDYYDYWQIKRPVFTCQDVNGDYFVAEHHRGTIKRALFFCQQGLPLLLISSPGGHGKTTLARWLYDQLPTESHEVLIVNLLEPPMKQGWLTRKITQFFGVEGDDPLAQPLQVLNELTDEDKKLLVIIDNAQFAANQIALDEIASFMQLLSLSESHISFLLLSDRSLIAELGGHPLARHIGFTSSLSPLTIEECKTFLEFQLRNQGLQEEIFTSDAIEILHDISKGIFRQVSMIAENCLMEAYIAEERTVNTTAVIKAASFVVGVEEDQLRTQYEGKLASASTPQPEADLTLETSPSNIDNQTDLAENSSKKIKLTDLILDEDLN